MLAQVNTYYHKLANKNKLYNQLINIQYSTSCEGRQIAKWAKSTSSERLFNWKLYTEALELKYFEITNWLIEKDPTISMMIKYGTPDYNIYLFAIAYNFLYVLASNTLIRYT